ncbi:hypothetical protein INT44_006554 [Umbelopsis vinacea]|uniref:FAD-binding domain-containing protein n=1 Tax=Umbelopsis vinacea TaxID=44442 RepID=A0A8H7UBR2_9FUNG|nr:hypothetical protein INT44_006554 [Umbelopsis vinacea]
MNLPTQDTDIIICGCGPTGALLAGYLGTMNIRCIVLEKEKEIVTDPRGIALDEDGVRLVQGLGLYSHVYTDIGTYVEKFKFVAGIHNDLYKRPFLTFDLGLGDGGGGHMGLLAHKQPALEKNLRLKMSREPTVDFRPSSTVVNISEDHDNVYVDYKDKEGSIVKICSKFLVAADGKTGFTRKQYLEPKGIIMENTNSKYNETWVALNWKITIPTQESHPDFPLWQLGYTPHTVYEKFFPLDFRFLCNPQRPAVCGRFGPPDERLWRFEFVVIQGEDEQKMSEYESIKKIVFPYITHSGSKYGLAQDVTYPEDCIEVLRCRPFKFAARSCNKWSLGRVILSGDAAHVFPPFGGQGIASGFRDASGLAWRLSVACRPNFNSYEMLFKGWYTERKQQLDRSLNTTVTNGRFVTEKNFFKNFIRDWGFWTLQLIPPQVRRLLEKGDTRNGLHKYKFEDGMAFLPKGAGGLHFPQRYAKRLTSGDDNTEIVFTDDLIFDGSKKCLFQLVVLVDKLSEVNADSLVDIEKLSNGELSIQDTTFLVHDPLERNTHDSLRVARIATVEEFAASPLCEGRLKPVNFDIYRIKKEVANSKYIIVRPDLYVFAACNDKTELDEAAASLAKLLS